MAIRQRLSLLFVTFVAALSASEPTAVAWVAFDFDQGAPDAACVAKCAVVRDREIAQADRLLSSREYFSKFDSNCWTLADAPNCAVVRQACRDACAPNYTSACMNACEMPFQTCCAANDRVRAQRGYDACVAECPAAKAAVAPPQPPPEPEGGRPSLTIAFSTAADARLAYEMKGWGQGKLDAWEAYQALRPAADRVADDVKRKAAFDEVRAHLKETGATFAVVSGGGGRLWVLRADGPPLLMPTNIATYMRMGAVGDPRVVAQLLSKQINLAPDETEKLIQTIQLWGNFGSNFKSGQVLSFHPRKSGAEGAPDSWGSSEHGSVRGTINGTGDFI